MKLNVNPKRGGWEGEDGEKERVIEVGGRVGGDL